MTANHKPKRTQRSPTAMAFMVIMTMALGGVVAVPSAAADNDCSDSNSGYGYEPVSCGEVSCLEGEFFYVDITASNQNDYVEAGGGCGTTDVECSDSDGGCAKWSDAPTTQGSHDGSCSGKAYVGTTGSVDLYCESGSSVQDTTFAVLRATLAMLLGSGDDLDVCNSLGLDGSERFWHLAWNDNRLRRITVVNGVCTDEQQDLFAQDEWVQLSV